MGRMYNPPHPGENLQENLLPARGLGVIEAAQQLGVPRNALSRGFNGHAAISPEMVRRIEAWLEMQMDYDLRVAEQKPAPKATRAPELKAA